MSKRAAPPSVAAPQLAFLSGGGEMGERIRAFDWDKTPLGPPTHWPQSLKTAVRIMLASRQPIWIGWGEQLIYLYNDPYKAIVGGRHPLALGKPTTEVWPEIWDIIGPMLEKAMSGVEGTYVKEQLLIMERHGYREETYYTYSYTPIPDEQGHAGGIICANTDDTERVIGQRQLALLRELSSVMSSAASAEQVCELAARIFAASNRDLSFALIYLLDAEGRYARLTSSSTLLPDSIAPRTVPLKNTETSGALIWPFQRAIRGETVTLAGLSKRARLPGGAWPEPTETALVLPLSKGSGERVIGILVAGVSPRRTLDDKYRDFFALLAGNLTNAITTSRAYQEERQRAQALAELDRAKTVFFNDVSHEFRTPLTLMLGPIEELRKSEISPEQMEQVELLQRNSLRLLKMVNTLLEFSRIEAGRIEANYEPTDLAAYTVELASVFRSAVEKAGLRFIVDCPPLPEPVYVDREMWEKVVLNLISNALKFTLKGEIKVSLRWCGERVELAVRDTGVGIPASELPRMFQRFFRVRGVLSRTHEGTGIGLALVQELAQLHGGEARVESEEGRGSTFLVSIRTGQAHLPRERIQIPAKNSDVTSHLGVRPFIEEALRWLPEAREKKEGVIPAASLATAKSSSKAPPPNAPYILLADDNADMREYVRRLLARDFQVVTVPDGEAALARIKVRRPDLVLSDVMMPRLDGFALLQQLRADERTRTIPVILLSARAGEEARVEGLDSGADDYLIKPFSARELLARVECHLRLSRLRREAEEKVHEVNKELSRRIIELQEARRAALNLVDDADRAQAALSATTAKFRSVFNQSGVFSGILDPNGIVREVSEIALTACGYQLNEVLGRPFWETPWWRRSDAVKKRIRDLAEEAAAGTAVHAILPYWWADGTERVFDFEMRPVRDESGRVMFLNPAGIDITGHKRAEEAIRHHAQEMETLLNVAPLGVFLVDANLRVTQVNPIALPSFGEVLGGVIGRNFSEIIHLLWPNKTADDIVGHYHHTLETGESFRDPEFVQPRIDRNNSLEYYEWRIDRITLPDGNYGVVCYFRDISEQVHARENLAYANDLLADRAKQLETLVARRTEELRETVQQLETFSYSIVHDMRAPLRSMRSFASILVNDYRDKLDENARSYLERIMSSSSRLDALITDVLTYSRVAMNQAELQPINLDKLATEIIEQYPQFQEASACIRIEHPLPPVLGNSALLTQVLSNLVGNALKFVPPNRKPQVTIRGETGHERVRLWVEDNGIGIPLRYQAQLFGLFQRLHRPDEYPGTGVGLAVVKRAVERMGGTVGLESEPGKGSRFWCEFRSGSAETNLNGHQTARQ